MDIERPVSAGNPVLATEFCGTSVTSNSRPQARTAQYVEMNPHIKFGRSDKRGYMLMDVTPAGLTTLCMGLDDVRDRHSAVATLGRFSVEPGRALLLQDGV
jgi:alkaline phosphatase D